LTKIFRRLKDEKLELRLRKYSYMQ